LATTGTLLVNGTRSYTPNGINWTITDGSAGAAGVMTVTVTDISNPACNFSAGKGPAILYIENKKWDDTSYGNFVCVPLSTTGALQIAIGDPVFNGTNSAFQTLGTDTYKKLAVDKYGTYVTKEDRTNQNGLATIYAPSSQMYFDVLLSAVGASVTGSTVVAAGGQLGNVLVKDTEVSSVSSKNLIVVGGSCINSVASTLLGGAGCAADFTAKTGIGAGQFLIQSIASPYSSNKVAVVVAGYEAADTVNAATYLTTRTVDTSVGKKYKGTASNAAELVVT
jgi:hypothetical protein